MTSSAPLAPAWARLLPLIIVVVILAVRFLRPQRISITRMWIAPIVLCGLTVWVIYVNQKLNPAPPLEIILGLVVGGLAGIPFGFLRGMHTDVRPTERPGVMYLGASWATLAIFVLAFGIRYAVRAVMPQHGSLAGTIGDALLAFAIAFIATSYVVIFRKYEAEVAGRLASPPPPTP
jgi:hypothetical protein